MKDNELKKACDLVEKACREIGNNCEIVFLEKEIQLARLDWEGYCVEKTLFEVIESGLACKYL